MLLPQGKDGSLSCLDSIQLARQVLVGNDMSFLQHVSPHPYPETEWAFWQFVVDGGGILPESWRDPIRSLVSVTFFAASRAWGYSAPHAEAGACRNGNGGAMTLDLHLEGRTRTDLASRTARFVQTLETLIRVLDHASKNRPPSENNNDDSSYLLTGDFSYILTSSISFRIAVLLATVSLLVKLWSLGSRPKMQKVGLSLLGVSVVLPTSMVVGRVDDGAVNTLFLLLYFSYSGMVQERLGDAKTSIHATAIVLAMIMHVVLLLETTTFGNPSLALFSFWFWSTWICLTPINLQSKPLGYAGLMVLVALWPPLSIMPFVLGSCTYYVLFVYTPLHMLVGALWLPPPPPPPVS